jgi:hypothetical protein
VLYFSDNSNVCKPLFDNPKPAAANLPVGRLTGRGLAVGSNQKREKRQAPGSGPGETKWAGAGANSPALGNSFERKESQCPF